MKIKLKSGYYIKSNSNCKKKRAKEVWYYQKIKIDLKIILLSITNIQVKYSRIVQIQLSKL